MATVAKNEPGALPLAEVLDGYRVMVTSRKVDDKEIQLKQQNLVFFQINGVGHEGFLAAASRHLSAEKDWFFTYYRDRALAIALGMTPYEIFLGSAGAAAGPDSAGRQMPNHFGQKRLHLAGPSSPTGTQCLQAVGFAEAGRYLRAMEKAAERAQAAPDEVVWVSLGDGTTSQGEFWESLNTACNSRLPVLYVIEDNGYAISVPVDVQTPGGSISKLVSGFPGLAVYEVDGCDFAASYRVAGEAVAMVRAGAGAGVGPRPRRAAVLALALRRRAPVQAGRRTRARGRARPDPAYREAAPRAVRRERRGTRAHRRRGPGRGQRRGRAGAAAAPARCRRRGRIASTRRRRTRPPSASRAGPQATDPAAEDDGRPAQRVPARRDGSATSASSSSARTSPTPPTRQALAEVKGKGGVFKVTFGLQRLYGARRVFNSPLAEANIVGRAVGMAMRGLKPVVEIQFLDYIWPAYMQIRNELANLRWRSGGSGRRRW